MRAREKALAKQTKQNYQAMNQQAGISNSYINPLQNIFK